MPEVRDQFRAELERFKASLTTWLAEGHGGQWVVIRGDETLGFFDSSRAGWRAAAEAYPDARFLVKLVVAVEPTVIVSHVCLHESPRD